MKTRIRLESGPDPRRSGAKASTLPNDHRSSRGVAFGLGAFTFWGLTPLYYRPIDHMGAPEILSHRILWAVVGLLILLAATRRFGRFIEVVKSPKTLGLLCVSGCLIAVNWLVFTWAVTNERVLEVSLGYFINPLFSVVLGVVFLRERLRPAQQVAVSLAAIGVFYLLADHGRLPWVAVVLPISFGIYGFMRKKIAVDPMSGLLVETMVTAPVALFYLANLSRNGASHFGGTSVQDTLLLVLGGAITIVPLTMFAAAARRVRLTTMGFMQYIAPSLNFLLAVFLFHEAFGVTQLITFSCIWLSLIIFTLEGIRFNRIRARRPEITAIVE